MAERFGAALFAAFFAVLWSFFLPFSALLWWLPASFLASRAKEMVPDGMPVESLLHLYATWDSIVAAGWESWWQILIGCVTLQKAMGMAHEGALEALNGGQKNDRNGAANGRPVDMLDKDGRPLGPQTVLVPGTQVRVDAHDGHGFRPYIMPGEPTFPSERRAIEAFFTKEERDALRASNVKPWESGARSVLTRERFEQIREEQGLWRDGE